MPRGLSVVIHWFRRDLRVADNTGLFHASHGDWPVVPLYIASDWRGSHAWTGPNRQSFLCGCLASLAANLETVGGRLIVRRGRAPEVFRELLDELSVEAIHCNADPDPFGKRTESELRRLCADSGVAFHVHHDVSLHAPDEVLTQNGGPYRVFTPYHRAWAVLPKPPLLPMPRNLGTPRDISSLPLPDLGWWDLPPEAAEILPPGERAARQRLKAFLGKTGDYARRRDVPAEDATSRLSQDLRFGLLSPRTVFHAALDARAAARPPDRNGADTFIKELAWREFYFAILHHFPNVLEEEFNADWRGLPWDQPDERFEAWKVGRTGFPIVDAGMRQLAATGFMHNRLRMIVAMFLTKDLHLDWRLGESFFMQRLVDGEIASNNGGWQWSAGTGADAAPYFRIQNPWSQSARHDPLGVYIKRWIPELRDVDPAKFTAPPPDGGSLAPSYPAPMVDHKEERERTLRIFKRHRQQVG